jgi:acyl transferase domain-containing protein
MARELFETESVFRDAFDACAKQVAPLGLDLTAAVYPGDAAAERDASAALGETSMTQPALFAVEYALSGLLKSWGVRPHPMIGHRGGG